MGVSRGQPISSNLDIFTRTNEFFFAMGHKGHSTDSQKKNILGANGGKYLHNHKLQATVVTNYF